MSSAPSGLHPPYDPRHTARFGAPWLHTLRNPAHVPLTRQTHRWTSLLFALLVGGLFLALGLGAEPAQWVYLLPLPPLFVLLLPGLWLFVLPYLGRRAAQ